MKDSQRNSVNLLTEVRVDTGYLPILLLKMDFYKRS